MSFVSCDARASSSGELGVRPHVFVPASEARDCFGTVRMGRSGGQGVPPESGGLRVRNVVTLFSVTGDARFTSANGDMQVVAQIAAHVLGGMLLVLFCLGRFCHSLGWWDYYARYDVSRHF